MLLYMLLLYQGYCLNFDDYFDEKTNWMSFRVSFVGHFWHKIPCTKLLRVENRVFWLRLCTRLQVLTKSKRRKTWINNQQLYSTQRIKLPLILRSLKLSKWTLTQLKMEDMLTPLHRHQWLHRHHHHHSFSLMLLKFKKCWKINGRK